MDYGDLNSSLSSRDGTEENVASSLLMLSHVSEAVRDELTGPPSGSLTNSCFHRSTRERHIFGLLHFSHFIIMKTEEKTNMPRVRIAVLGKINVGKSGRC
ncbi:hypothetical protein C0J52_27337 [Blattella germanica]|nr:hypothetical protein C0J52_27337 [Blattella germanica]